MKNEEILKKAIKKAVKNSFIYAPMLLCDNKGKKLKITKIREIDIAPLILFNKNFAKAFFGEKWKDGDEMSVPMSDILSMENIAPWQYHLRIMVLQEEPLKYLEKFI